MKLQFKHQQFQADAAAAVVDIFKGMPRSTREYLFDSGAVDRGDLKFGLYSEFGGYQKAAAPRAQAWGPCVSVWRAPP